MADRGNNYDRQVDIAREIFLQYAQEPLIEKFSLEADEEFLYLKYLNTDCRICRKSGQVDEKTAGGLWTECRKFNTVMTIYDLLCYHQGEKVPVQTGIWRTIESFTVSGEQKFGTFTGEAASVFETHKDRLKPICESLGGILQTPLAGADVTCLFPVTDFFSLLLQYWAADEEFPPQVRLMWDENTLKFLHFETTFYLQGDLLGRICLRLKEI